MTVRCDNCPAHAVVILSYRLNPHNWQPHHKRLCQPCRAKLGYTPVDYTRPYTDAAGPIRPRTQEAA